MELEIDNLKSEIQGDFAKQNRPNYSTIRPFNLIVTFLQKPLKRAIISCFWTLYMYSSVIKGRCVMPNTVEQSRTVQVPVTPGSCGVNIQIFNPASYASVAPSSSYSNNFLPSYPQNYYTQNFTQPPPVVPAATPTQPQTTHTAESKKTEKREIVQLTDTYIKNLETALNNQNSQVRLMAAKEVLARLQEDPSRKDDPALNALVNKMLQDPYAPVKMIAMSAIESRIASGDDTSIKILQNIQKQKTANGEDSLQAHHALLQMSAKTTQKEFEAKEKPQKTKKQGEK